MRWTTSLALGLLAVSCCCPQAVAWAEEAKPGAKAEEPAEMRRKITVEFVDMPLSEVLLFLGKQAHVRIELDPGLGDGARDGNVNWRGRDVPVADALRQCAAIAVVPKLVELVYEGGVCRVIKKPYPRTVPGPFAPLTKEQEEALPKAIRDLDSQDPNVRDRASNTIEAMGLSVLPHLEKALADEKANTGTDPERKARLAQLIDKLSNATDAIFRRWDIEKDMKWKITTDFEGASITEAFTFIFGRLKRSSIVTPAPEFLDVKLHYKAVNQEAREVIKGILRSVGAKLVDESQIELRVVKE